MMPSHNEFTAKPTLKLGRYRHYKGGEYEVLHLACDEVTHEWLVVYKPLYDTKGAPEVWVRTYAAFTENVFVDGETTKRFSPL